MLIKKKNKITIIILLQVAIFLMSFTGIISKKASTYPINSIQFIGLFSLSIIMLFFYAIFWQQILKRIDLVIAYTSKGVSVIWIFCWATLFFGETITINNIVGAFLVICGIVFMMSNSNE